MGSTSLRTGPVIWSEPSGAQWSANLLATCCEELTPWKRPWHWERLRAGREGGNREWDGWMAFLTQWTWVWVSSGRWWRIGEPGVLHSVGLQRAGQDWATEQQREGSFFPFHCCADGGGYQAPSLKDVKIGVMLAFFPCVLLTLAPVRQTVKGRQWL